LDKKRLEELKEKYWVIYEEEIDGINFVFRGLSRGEYNKVLRAYDDDPSKEEYICELCVIEPEDFDFTNCEAGIPTVLARRILEESGFSTVPTGKLQSVLNSYREEMDIFQNQVSCIIHEAFPNLDLEEIETWPMEKTLWYYSRAEYVLNVLRGMQFSGGDQAAANPQGNAEDFPELAREQAFMQGKLR
jgi:hypothetical protein